MLGDYNDRIVFYQFPSHTLQFNFLQNSDPGLVSNLVVSIHIDLDIIFGLIFPIPSYKTP